MKQYDSTEIEKKWQTYWAENNTYKVENNVEGKENFYALSEFSYPSGNLHVGHWYAFAVPDIYARFKRMNGYNVLYPMGFDAFGLPAENAAIKRGLDPRKWTYENMEYMRGQLKSMGASFDWDRSFATCDPDYYKWTQWMFTEFYKNDLVHRSLTKTNWCESCKTVLANEQVVNGECERCGNDVVQKEMAQWMLNITKFADELIDDLDTLDWDHSIKQAQREWIGRKEGSEISFSLTQGNKEGKVFGEITEDSTERNLVKILLRNSKGELLLFKEERFGMDLPGGHVEDSEDIKDAAVRELKEETIYTNFKFIKEICKNEIHYYHMNNKSYHHGDITILLYELENEEISDTDFQEGENIVNTSWVNPVEMSNNFLTKDAYSEGLHNGLIIYNNLQDKKVFGKSVDGSKNRKTVKVILKNSKGEILIMQSVDGAMDLPGGGIEEGETIQEAAVRELLEETEYTNIRFIKLVGNNITHSHHKPSDTYCNCNVSVVLCELEDEEKSDKNIGENEPDTIEVWMNPKNMIKDFIPNPVYKNAPREWVKQYINSKIDVFTTRADTLFGVTYVVLAPEHKLISELKQQIQNWDEVEKYLKDTEKKSDLDRQQSKEKTGVFLKGVSVINPATNQEIPVLVADYVLAHFGTGAVMAVPTHDERDCEFAIKFELPFKFVVLPSAGPIGSSRQLVTSGENAFILAAGTTEESGQPKINAEWNAMYDLLGTSPDGILPVGKRFCCTFTGKLMNSPTPENKKPVFLGFNHPRDNKEWKEKKRVYAVVKQKDKEIYLGLKSLTDGVQGLITGGIDEGEKSEDTVVREVLEEAGYTASVIKKEPYQIIDRYYTTNKDMNISSVGDVFLLEVEDINNIAQISEEELEKAEAVWMNKQEFINWINPPSHKYILEKIFKLKDSCGRFNAQTSEEAQSNITKAVGGILKKTYRLRDWGISRQRYWGTPIPMVYDPDGNAHPVPAEHLPWILPDDVDYTPDGTAPLARSAELKQRTISIFGAGWTPEVDTMDTFVDSSWYFYRYLDNKNNDNFASAESMKSWMPVDMYFGGAEHTTMHLLYSRFWVKALHSLGLVPANEPYKGRLNRGLILGTDGLKMSKSKGNVVDPDDVVSHVGADALRMYLAFMGPFNEPGNYPWDPNGVVGVRRFIERVWRLSEKVSDGKSSVELEKLVHKTIKKVTDDVERLKLNTAISSMMVLVNSAEKSEAISKIDYESLLKMFGAFAPHAAEEIWQEILEHSESIHISDWPKYDESLCTDDEITLGIQINGKVRSEITISIGADSDTVQEMVLKLDDVIKWMDGKDIKKFIYVPGRIINIVI